MFNRALKLTRSLWIGSVLVGMMVAGPSLAEDVAIGPPKTSNSDVLPPNSVNKIDRIRGRDLTARPQLNAAFTPWCAKRSYLCASRPEAPFSHLSAWSDRSGSKRPLQVSAEANAANVGARVR